MALTNRWKTALAVGVCLIAAAGCDGAPRNESNPIGPPVDPSTVRTGETFKETMDRINKEAAEFERSKQGPRRRPTGRR